MTFLESLLLVVIVVMAIRLYSDRRTLNRMLEWISGPLDAPVPDASGIWGDFVSRMNRRVRTRQQEKNQLETALEQFQSALEALPDGVVFMDGHRQILWMNSLAVSMLDLVPTQDKGTPIEQLIREPEFVSYLLGQDFSEPLIYHPSRRTQACYMISLISYGNDRLLLTARDLTQLEKLENVRRDFVANVSHELKTPLTVISGFLETLFAVLFATNGSSHGFRISSRATFFDGSYGFFEALIFFIQAGCQRLFKHDQLHVVRIALTKVSAGTGLVLSQKTLHTI